MNKIEQDVESLKRVVKELTELLFASQVEMRALQRVLIERHGLSFEALTACRAHEQAKLDGLRGPGTPSQTPPRFEDPPR